MSLDFDAASSTLTQRLQTLRLAMPDRLERAVQLQSMLRAWLATRPERAIAGYWPIKGEFDPMPALFRWSEGGLPEDDRRIGLPVQDTEQQQLRFHVWYPGCPMEPDVHQIPKPKGTDVFTPEMVLVPCVGYGPAGVRLGYGGGFYARSLHRDNPIRPLVVGLCYAFGFVPLLKPNAEALRMDVVITEEGVVWERR